MDKSHDPQVMGGSIRVSVQPVVVEIGDVVKEELFPVPLQFSVALHRKIRIFGVTATHQGMIGLNHL